MQRVPIVLVGVIAAGACAVSQKPSSWTDDSACQRDCAAEESWPCAGAPTESECVAVCEAVRASRAECLSEDTAFRQCFVTYPMLCVSGRRVTSSCTAERQALESCIAPQSDGGTPVDSGADANGE